MKNQCGKDQEKEQHRQKIMSAAKRVFIDNGYDHSTIKEIANESGISVGLIYIYFKNKEQLYASLTIPILTCLLKRIGNIKIDDQMPMERRLQCLKCAILDAYDHSPDNFIILLNIQSSDSFRHITIELLTEINRLESELMGQLNRLLKETFVLGELKDAHGRPLADILWGLYSGIILGERINTIGSPGVNSVRTKFELAFDIFVRGIKPLLVQKTATNGHTNVRLNRRIAVAALSV